MSRRLNTFGRIIKSGLVGFTRNISLAAASIAVMTITLTIILFSVLASATFNHTIDQIRSRVSVSIYLVDSASQDQVNNFIVKLKNQNNVKSVTYISKDQALAIYKSENAGNKTLISAVSQTANPLPASIEIEPYDINKLQDIKDFIDKPQYLALQDPQAGTSYSGDRKLAIDKISHATSLIREAGIVAVIVFALISMLIIFNTIKMAIFNRREEIRTMRLLGANSWYIRGPFVVESILYGFISAIASLLIINTIFLGTSSGLQATSLGLLDIGYSQEYFKSNLLMLLTTQLGAGILIGAVSSVIATRRYLKIKPAK
ncbi:MAG TPA: permease-like cell division protein FtsX [Candidatus Saccharimonadales bacterium]